MKIEAFAHSIKLRSEDVYGVTRHGAFVIDGASALEESFLVPGGNSVVWMVEWWKKYLTERLDDLKMPLKRILEQGVSAFNDAFSEFKPVDELSKLEQVSASIAIVRENGTELESFVLGDAEISHKYKDGGCEILTDETNKQLDSRVIELMNSSNKRERFCVFKDFTEEELELLKKNRMKMNTEEGYYILSHDVKAIAKGIHKFNPIDSVESCLLMSDGLSPLDGCYERPVLMDAIRKRGIRPLIEELRDREKRDAEGNVFKSLKTHDDATAVFMKF